MTVLDMDDDFAIIDSTTLQNPSQQKLELWLSRHENTVASCHWADFNTIEIDTNQPLSIPNINLFNVYRSNGHTPIDLRQTILDHNLLCVTDNDEVLDDASCIAMLIQVNPLIKQSLIETITDSLS